MTTENTTREAELASTALFDLLGEFLKAGGMIGEPQDEDDTWQLGWNAGMAYCIESEGDTLREAVALLDPEILDVMRSNDQS